MDIKIDRPQFLQKNLHLDFLVDRKEMEQGVSLQPGKLYKFNYEK